MAVVALAAVTLAACSDDKPVTAPVATSRSAVPSSSAPAPDEPQTTRILTRLAGLTGQWQATLGKTTDRGDLTINFRCTGGGRITVATSHGHKATNSCDGGTKLLSESIEVPSGAVTITVEPDSTQQWSLLVARGSIPPGGEWPTGAPDIPPGG
jgi:hypothetical protein